MLPYSVPDKLSITPICNNGSKSKSYSILDVVHIKPKKILKELGDHKSECQKIKADWIVCSNKDDQHTSHGQIFKHVIIVMVFIEVDRATRKPW